MTTLQTSAITLPCKDAQTLEASDMQFWLGSTLSLEGELKAERARTQTLQKKLLKQQEEHEAEARRFVGQNARLNQEVQNLKNQLARLRDVCGFD
mgnify:FL=1|jgi:predicted  nucleic acid-binding Zn-ribbon protein